MVVAARVDSVKAILSWAPAERTDTRPSSLMSNVKLMLRVGMGVVLIGAAGGDIFVREEIAVSVGTGLV